MKRFTGLLFNIALQADADAEESDSCMQKLLNLPSLLALRKVVVLMRKTDNISEVNNIDATAMYTGESVDIKKDSSCGVVQNVICLNTQSISGL